MQWQQVASGNAAASRTQHSTCYHASSDVVLLVGGYSTAQGHLNDMWALDVGNAQMWKPADHGEMPGPRRGHVAEVVGDTMWVFGGASQSGTLGDLYKLNISTWHWVQVRAVQGNGTMQSWAG